MIKPSLIGHVISGFILFIAMIILYINRQNLKGVELANVLIMLSVALTLHSMFHLFAEAYFNFNPLEGKFIY